MLSMNKTIFPKNDRVNVSNVSPNDQIDSGRGNKNLEIVRGRRWELCGGSRRTLSYMFQEYEKRDAELFKRSVLRICKMIKGKRVHPAGHFPFHLISLSPELKASPGCLGVGSLAL